MTKKTHTTPVALRLALRYLLSRQHTSVINIISWISLIGVAVSTMALIVVLSVYNGIGDLTQNLFNIFDPELKIEPSQGKTLHANSQELAAIYTERGVLSVSAIVEEECWVSNGDYQAIATLRGVDGNYGSASGLDTCIYEGVFLLYDSTSYDTPIQYIVPGATLYYTLGAGSTNNNAFAIRIPHRKGALGYTVDQAFNTATAFPIGCFAVQQEVDSRYIIANAQMVRELMEYDDDECTALCVHLKENANASRVKRKLQQDIGSDYTVKDRFDQQPLYYKIYHGERFGIILILALIVTIASLSLVASLSLLILDKKHDIGTLKSLGMPLEQIRRTFFIEGELISIIGIASGLFLGFIVCFIQQQFGIVKMGSGFIIEAFPVAMHFTDFMLTFLLVLLLTTIAVFSVTQRQFKR